MRRARIKATAVVPVRRKAQPVAAAPAELPKETSEPEPEEPVENNVKSTETTSSEETQKPGDQVEACKSPEINNVSSPEKDKESEEIITQSPVKPKETTEKVVHFVKQNESAEPEICDANSDIEAKDAVQSIRSLESPARAETPVQIESIKKVEILTRTEKSPAPTVESSPVKSIQSRSHFTRPTPRLDGGGRVRRNSIQGSGASASESEDDSKRSTSIIPSRVRNDSICSVQSLKDTSNTNSVAAKLNLGQKRRMVVSESARKLAEARREFNLKHENKTPAHDKSTLTMYDLIYYNPLTNPMKPKPVNSKPAARKLPVCSVVENEKEKEEEIADDSSEMPVPQVKVGPNGELIIDEQSLVIDQYKVQENVDRTNIIVDDDNTGNGFYKKRQKSKDWNKWETVKFYKALNTYGTDFLLMQSIFSNRTRIELKLKYKKEERINPNLVEKALRYQEFDTEALEKDLANVEENQKKESELKKKGKKNNSSLKRNRRRCKLVSDEITGDIQNENSVNNSDDNQSSDEDVRITITAKKVRKRRRRKTKSSEIVSDKSDKDDSESNPEVYSAQPTRSGRAPKKPKRAPKPIKVFDVQEKKKPRGRPRKQKILSNNEKITENADVIMEVIDLQEEKTNESNNLNIIEKNKTDNNNVRGEESNTVVAESNEKIIIETIEQSQKENDTSKVLEANKNASNALSEITDDIPNMSNLKPGSLVVLKKDSEKEPGKTTLQVYIVSDDYDVNNPNYKESLLPIDMSPEELQTVTKCIQNITPQNIS